MAEVLAGQPAGKAYRNASGYCAIEDYAIIGNGITAALIARDGSLDWACFPRFDSPSVFARVLDARRGGAWSLQPTSEFTSSRAYVEDTNVLVTTFRSGDGEAEVVDFMPPPSAEGNRLADASIVRLIRCTKGSVEFETRFEPRFDYARATTKWALEPGTGARALLGREHSLTLYTGWPFELRDGAVTARQRLAAGEQAELIARFRQPASLVWHRPPAPDAERLLKETESFWRGWISRCNYHGPYAAAVRRSALLLKLLNCALSGAIVAAPTTSLPERIGGVRNWDYRYTWLRDSGFTLYALYLLGFREEGAAFFDWILQVVHDAHRSPDGPSGSPSDGKPGEVDPAALQAIYGIDGATQLPEVELDHLEGYMKSRPVRAGNAAYSQRQLDVYGELLDCAFLLHKYGGRISRPLWDFLRSLVDFVCEAWHEPDHGIWEVRSEPRHFVYSKALCWVALDRGIKLAEREGFDADLPRWEQNRQLLLADIIAKGYSEELQSFTQSYGDQEVDAALLGLMLRKVLKPGDPHMQATVRRVVNDLDRGGLLHRYNSETVDDGLPGGEGVFLMCSFWLVDCYAEMGRMDEARELFERLLGYANDVGLYAEELDPATGHHLGNFPQAFTHVALVNAAVALGGAEGLDKRLRHAARQHRQRG